MKDVSILLCNSHEEYAGVPHLTIARHSVVAYTDTDGSIHIVKSRETGAPQKLDSHRDFMDFLAQYYL